MCTSEKLSMSSKKKDRKLIKKSRRGNPTLKLSIFPHSPYALPSPPFSPSRIQEGRSILEREVQNSPNLSPTVIKPFMYPWRKWSLQKEVHILLPTYPSPFPSSTHTHTCVKPLTHPWVEVKFVYPANDSRSGDKFPKKLWCYVGGGYNKMIWFYQLNWKCELATVKVSKEDTLSVSTRGLTFQMLA